MCRMNRYAGWSLLMLASLLASCHTDMFNEEDYKEIVEIAQPVQGIEEDHTWNLTTTYFLTLEAGSKYKGASRFLILSGSPLAGSGVTLLGSYLVTEGEKSYVSFIAPSHLTKFWAALVDADGKYVVTPFSSTQHSINFSQSTVTKGVVDENKLNHQSFSYCFEDEMPEPGDYDYNDVVLRISQERTSENQITVNVTLAAVGSLSQVAAAMRIANYKYDDIESVTTLDNESFDDGLKKTSLPFIESRDLLIKGIDDAAVINLFEDAHWATGATRYASEGYIERYKYNVSKTTSSQYDMMSPRTISYVITFKNPSQLDYFTLDLLDPFIIVEYMGTYMEVHAVYRYRSNTALHEYVQPNVAVILPWALTVPDGSFRYPLDGVNIGFAKDGALFGAYMTGGHSFGEWASNRLQAIDWYYYPTANQVY